MSDVYLLSPPVAHTTYRRRCGTCLRSAKDVYKLAECQGCLQEYYCSTVCQKHHWPTHKAFCKMSAELMETTSHGGGSVWQDLGCYIRSFHDPLTTGMLCSYNLPVYPFAHLQETFVVHLRYVPDAVKPAQRFKIWRLSKTTLTELFASVEDSRKEAMIEEDQRMLEEARDVLGEHFAGLGHICYIVEQGNAWTEVIRINPVAFDREVAAAIPHRMWGLALVQAAGNLTAGEVRELLKSNNWRV